METIYKILVSYACVILLLRTSIVYRRIGQLEIITCLSGKRMSWTYHWKGEKVIFLSSLRMKLGMVKQFVKALNVESNFIKSIHREFPRLSYYKITAHVVDGLQKTEFLKVNEWYGKKRPWESFILLVKIFWVKTKAENDYHLVETLLEFAMKRENKVSFPQRHCWGNSSQSS